MTKLVGFFDNSFSYRGTTRALIDYCFLASERLGWNCHILFNIDSPHNSSQFIRECFRSDFPFPIIGIQDPYGVKNTSTLQKYDHLYFETVGIDHLQKQFISQFDGQLLLHQIGFEKSYKANQKQNQLSFYCSYWQSFYFSAGLAPVLPYLVDLTDDSPMYTPSFRKQYGIPDHSIVLGRHGGFDTWNLPFVNQAITEVLNIRDDIWFLFVNTPAFVKHPRAIFLDTIVSKDIIIEYVISCDAMIHARWEGETFGLACAEFLKYKRPIITWSGSRERSHIYFADNSASLYNQLSDLRALLLDLDKHLIDAFSRRINHKLFQSCAPQNIATILESVFT